MSDNSPRPGDSPPAPAARGRALFLIALTLQAVWLVFLLAMALRG